MRLHEGFKTVFWIVLVLATVGHINGEDPVRASLKHSKAEVEIDNGITLRIYYNEIKAYEMNIGQWMPTIGHPNWTVSDDEFESQWENGLRLNIRDTSEGFLGNRVQWTAPLTVKSIDECFDLGKGNWYGGSEQRLQAWPIQNRSLPPTVFITSSATGGVLDRYFLSSDGYAYYVDETVPLFVSLAHDGNRTLCFRSSFERPYVNTNGRPLSLTYHVVVGSDLLDVHKKASTQFFPKPVGIPSERMITLPVWSTWDLFRKDVNQTKVLQLAQEIRQHGFPIGQIEIDDGWESCYGDETFDVGKFPNPIGMVHSLRLQGIDVTLWVHPYVNIECYNRFQEGVERRYFVSNRKFNETAAILWRDGTARIIDVTNSEATRWWAQRLNGIRQEVGVASFKFDAGDEHFAEHGYYYGEEDLQPGIFATEFATFASQFGDQVDVNIGYRTQRFPTFVRMADRQSTWGLEFGLASTITSALHLGIVGYPFVLPDVIAGNGYGIDPTPELFIRWVQVAAFFPAMQFSFTPWSFGQEVTDIALKMVALHRNIASVFVAAARQSTVDGSPIIRPLWWISPNDTTAQVVDDEFLVGDQYLVAPILSEGQSSRDIYLPEGRWRNELSGEEISGPLWLRDYYVALWDIPYFTNLNN